jgi:hypothetical protein
MDASHSNISTGRGQSGNSSQNLFQILDLLVSYVMLQDIFTSTAAHIGQQVGILRERAKRASQGVGIVWCYIDTAA